MEETKVTNSQDQDKSSFVVLMLTLGLRNLFALTTPPSKAKLWTTASCVDFFLSFFLFFVFVFSKQQNFSETLKCVCNRRICRVPLGEALTSLTFGTSSVQRIFQHYWPGEHQLDVSSHFNDLQNKGN